MKVPTDWTSQGIWSTLLRMLGRRAWGSEELRRACLTRYAMPDDLLDQAILKLQDLALLNDALYAEQLLRQCQRRGYGPRRIQSVFRTKGLERTHVDRLLPAIYGEETDHIQELAKRKWLTMPAKLTEEQRRARLFRFLVGRGFSSQAALSVIQSLR